ncbi:hypothetical protein BKA70DRAFT_1456693 [Coprinopsis sp. MPI-PUGE-AT-0042]|nr:hypothetical protein BKA70DRAFT_1456693 [Coprinopsis sp. MPI-PUGE-AT-0042]
MVGIQDFKSILITGATSGIGRALARSLTTLESRPRVIGVGRRDDRLQELKNEGIEALKFDTDTDEKGIQKFVDETLAKYPDLDCIILNAGIQHTVDLTKEVSIQGTSLSYLRSSAAILDPEVQQEININYTSVVTTILKFLPHFQKLSAQGKPSAIVTVTSGLAIVPGAWCANYSATKAAVHAFTQSLRLQLKDTKIKVMEIAPPLVESELHDSSKTTEQVSKFWVPLDEFTKQVVDGLKAGNDVICHDSQISKGNYDRFEGGKTELMAKSYGWFCANVKE